MTTAEEFVSSVLSRVKCLDVLQRRGAVSVTFTMLDHVPKQYKDITRDDRAQLFAYLLPAVEHWLRAS